MEGLLGPLGLRGVRALGVYGFGGVRWGGASLNQDLESC